MKLRNILLILFSIFLWACGNNTHHNQENQVLTLDNGKKWKLDANIITYIRNMEQDAQVFKGTSLLDYKALVSKMEENIHLLTSNCKMKGKAHEELYNWLLPYMGLVREMAAATNEKEANAKFEEIKGFFVIFNIYFE